jgi:hypothetical protein
MSAAAAAMPERGIDPLSHALGALTTKVDLILKTLSENREADAQYRTRTQAELSAIRDKVDKAEVAAKKAEEGLERLEPIVASLQAKALLGDGERAGTERLAGLLAKAAHIVSAGIGGAIVFFLQRWFPK